MIRGHRVIQALDSPGTLLVGFGGDTPQFSMRQLQRGDRLLFYTDGVVEEHQTGGEQFGEERLITTIERVGPASGGVQEMMRGLSHSLMRERGGTTTDDAILFLVEWRAGTADHLAGPEL